MAGIPGDNWLSLALLVGRAANWCDDMRIVFDPQIVSEVLRARGFLPLQPGETMPEEGYLEKLAYVIRFAAHGGECGYLHPDTGMTVASIAQDHRVQPLVGRFYQDGELNPGSNDVVLNLLFVQTAQVEDAQRNEECHYGSCPKEHIHSVLSD